MSWFAPANLSLATAVKPSSSAAPEADTPMVYPDHLCGSILEVAYDVGLPRY